MRASAGVLIAWLTMCPSGDPAAGPQDDPSAALVATMKRQLELPRNIDDTQRLDDIRAGRREIRYYLTLLGVPADTDARDAAYARLREDVTANACADASYRRLHAAGLAVAFHYRSATGAPFPPIRIAPESCQNTGQLP